jgi:hypothetical protein
MSEIVLDEPDGDTPMRTPLVVPAKRMDPTTVAELIELAELSEDHG